MFMTCIPILKTKDLACVYALNKHLQYGMNVSVRQFYLFLILATNFTFYVNDLKPKDKKNRRNKNNNGRGNGNGRGDGRRDKHEDRHQGRTATRYIPPMSGQTIR